MDKLEWIAVLGDPMTLVVLLLGGYLPLALLPAPFGQMVAGTVIVATLLFNRHIDRSTKRLPVRSGPEALRGRPVVVLEALKPEGLVRCDGETWKAVEVRGRWVEPGEEVTVVGVSGLDLKVVRRDREAA